MEQKQISFWVRDWLILSASVMIATWALGIPGNLATLMLAAAVISLLNSFVRPMLLVLSLPFLIAQLPKIQMRPVSLRVSALFYQ